MKTIRELRRTPINEYLDKPISETFLYIDKSFEKTYNYHLYYFYSKDTSDYSIIPGYDVPMEKISFEDYLDLLRLNLIEEIYSDIFYSLFKKYNYLFNEFKNKEGLYSLYAAFHLMLLSKEVSQEEKEILFDYKILEYELENIELKLNLDKKEDFFVNEFIFNNKKNIKELKEFFDKKDASEKSIIAKGKHSLRILDKMSSVYKDKDLKRIKNDLFSTF